MAENSWKCLKSLEMTENIWKWLEMAKKNSDANDDANVNDNDEDGDNEESNVMAFNSFDCPFL